MRAQNEGAPPKSARHRQPVFGPDQYPDRRQELGIPANSLYDVVVSNVASVDTGQRRTS